MTCHMSFTCLNFAQTFEVHCEEVDKEAQSKGNFDKIPEQVISSIILHKGRCIEHTAEEGWSQFLEHALPWPQPGDEGSGFSLCEPTLRRYQRTASVKIQLSQRMLCEKVVGLVKAGRDGVAGLLELRVAMKEVAMKFPPEDVAEAMDTNSFLTFLNETLDVLDAVGSLSGELEPGMVEASVVRKVYSKAKGQSNSLCAVVTAALATSSMWQAGFWLWALGPRALASGNRVLSQQHQSPVTSGFI